MFIRSCTHCLTPMYYIVVYQYWPLTDAHYAFIHPLISLLIYLYFRLNFLLAALALNTVAGLCSAVSPGVTWLIVCRVLGMCIVYKYKYKSVYIYILFTIGVYI